MNNIHPERVAKELKLPGLLWVCGLTAGISILGYILYSGWFLRIGFPLDDAWIHQTYARNLVQFGEWAFFPGKPSAGSTSPLWTAFLALGYIFQKGIPYAWTYFLGFLTLWVIGFLGQNLFALATGKKTFGLPWMGLFLIFEWHLVWAAGSGMETSLMAVIVLAVFVLLAKGGQGVLIAGFLAGLSVWVRPDGITLLAPVLLITALINEPISARIKRGLVVFGGFLIPFGLYLFFNWVIGGSFWPNTFYAKQAEYAALLSQPFIVRFADLAFLPLVGAGILLLPGFFYFGWQALMRRRWTLLAMYAWWIGYTSIYAFRLPVVYQHGRYLIPAMPVFFVLGFVGTKALLEVFIEPSRLKNIVKKFYTFAIPLVLILFYALGMQAYAKDVAVIETEMVNTAKWINENILPTKVLAVHDIGAIGYFAKNDLIDLAGLVSPEVIPFIRDEVALARYLDTTRANFLVTFPGWYPHLIKRGILVYTSGGRISPEMGGENMAVFQWQELHE
jgi:hypothetical protein